ncbi:MAG: glycosyltransferase family 4 protein [Halanaerobiales bacterium]|nr:glycosyltransferase family 4 protein [Halanaerobiales bacterium]HPZ61933.1 glycosyltransferase family 4 protein [Halanaerobiales bacterium]HQD03344.1 glycosyltransferase family 4 protein [Halanaerobiales bacterium]
MRILMLSWEYPPVSHGGLARHVQDLSEALVRKGIEVFVVTQGSAELPADEIINGVRVLRTIPVAVTANNFVEDILQLNFQLLERALVLFRELDNNLDIIHGHDWLVFWASKVLKHSFTTPLIYTIHATEFGRNQGIYNDMQRYINDLEWYASFEAWKLIVCSQYMNNEVRNLFQVPEDKAVVIGNGVNEENYRGDSSPAYRDFYASPDEDIVFYVGRIVREKGIQVLIQAIPEILKTNPKTKFVIAGKGPYLDNLRSLAEYLGVAERVYFTGFISDRERNNLYRIADVAVFPSLYEPFGIVALEAMVTRTPVIVSEVGGLAEFVRDGENGLTVKPNDPQQLAEKIRFLLNNKERAREMASRAYEIVKRDFTWDEIANKTLAVYEEVIAEYRKSGWSRKKKVIERREDREEFIHRYAGITVK